MCGKPTHILKNLLYLQYIKQIIMKDSKIAFDYRDNSDEPYIDRLWVNKETGKVELIRIPVRGIRNAPVIKYHKSNTNYSGK